MDESRSQLEQSIVEKAMKDDSFRKALHKDPKAAIEETLGIKLPEDVNINVNLESEKDIHITIPYTNEELSEDELSGVSGDWNVCEYSGGM